MPITRSKRCAKTDLSRCVSCGACTKTCPKGAIAVFRGCYALVNSDTCIGCKKCAKVCPADCITLFDREVGA